MAAEQQGEEVSAPRLGSPRTARRARRAAHAVSEPCRGEQIKRPQAQVVAGDTVRDMALAQLLRQPGGLLRLVGNRALTPAELR
jgi:hypothetical protein